MRPIFILTTLLVISSCAAIAPKTYQSSEHILQKIEVDPAISKSGLHLYTGEISEDDTILLAKFNPEKYSACEVKTPLPTVFYKIHAGIIEDSRDRADQNMHPYGDAERLAAFYVPDEYLENHKSITLELMCNSGGKSQKGRDFFIHKINYPMLAVNSDEFEKGAINYMGEFTFALDIKEEERRYELKKFSLDNNIGKNLAALQKAVPSFNSNEATVKHLPVSVFDLASKSFKMIRK